LDIHATFIEHKTTWR